MSTGLAVVLGVLVGLTAGAVIVWAVLARRLATVTAERDDRSDRNAELTGERDAARIEADQQRDAASDLRAKLASAEAERDARVEEMAKQQAEIEGRFKEIAAQVSETTRDTFMKEFRDLSAEQTKTAGKTVSELVAPMRERLQELQHHIQQANEARVADTTKVSQSVEQLVSETSTLRQVLGDSRMRGEWGQQHLRNVIEAAGMSPHIDFVEQPTVGEAGSGGQGRPDVVVRIPDGANVVIDAKTPLAAYQRAIKARNESDHRAQSQAMAEHAVALRDRAKELRDRDYSRWVSESPDFVLMYVPTDPMLDDAMGEDPEIWLNAWQRYRVLIATPGLLIAFLRTVAIAWQRHNIARDAEELAEHGTELVSRLSKYVEHVDKMGRGLRSALSAYNDSVGSLERMVLPQARRFDQWMRQKEREALESSAPIDAAVRTVNAPELSSGDDRLDGSPRTWTGRSRSPGHKFVSRE